MIAAFLPRCSQLVSWIGGSRLVYDFAHNASRRFAPPYWVKGEDSAFGFFAFISPFAVTPHHWGWNVVHDGWEFRSEAERGLCTQHVRPNPNRNPNPNPNPHAL